MARTLFVRGRHYSESNIQNVFEKFKHKSVKIFKITESRCSICDQNNLSFLLSKWHEEEISWVKENVKTNCSPMSIIGWCKSK